MHNNLLKKFIHTRENSEKRCEHLEIEDYSVQPIVDVSPPKWHLAHTTWFFEQFVLVPHAKNYSVYNERFAYLFNSYYNTVGDRVLRPNRGLMTRPTVKEIYRYREYVTSAMIEFLETDYNSDLKSIIELGINHEEQHQELLMYDIKYILGNQPYFPTYQTNIRFSSEEVKQEFAKINAGIYQIGYDGNGFSFDNEHGKHKVYLEEFEISNRLVTCGEYLEFMKDDGYKKFELWHADGWNFINTHNINAPLYWYKKKGQWFSYDYKGFDKIDKNLPVSHISYYEAFAFANWKKMRLPTEFEWEVSQHLFKWGQVWEWTSSAYQSYPRFKTEKGAIGEYNGKFMVNQQVLRGGSIATIPGHSRNTYRNFFNPQLRWHFSGIRLVK
ncbi:ergothioneine biosynthesis protein EgtB [Crocinitomix algicola]|uniref:ergothioneine biosynthesis protein EgtB n=1 Tax=Crocinitomix algicola TaxID=1740263 RepID=UPI0008342A4C|nr:ergothioneine biosynthesis protein EgtB [Crocinitomix algicola]